MRHEQVARQDARLGGGAVFLDLGDDRIGDRLAVDRKKHGEDRDREDEIGDRAGGDGGSALPQLGAEKGAIAVFGGILLEATVVRNARRILVAEELDVAAERNGANLPARPVFVGIAEQFRTEADGKGEDADAGPAADQVVTHLVHEDDQRQHQQKRHDIAENKVKHIGQVSHVDPSIRYAASIHGPSRIAPMGAFCPPAAMTCTKAIKSAAKQAKTSPSTRSMTPP